MDKLHAQVDLSNKNFNNKMAINAVQICTFTAFSLVPTKVLILNFV